MLNLMFTSSLSLSLLILIWMYVSRPNQNNSPVTPAYRVNFWNHNSPCPTFTESLFHAASNSSKQSSSGTIRILKALPRSVRDGEVEIMLTGDRKAFPFNLIESAFAIYLSRSERGRLVGW